MNKEKLKASLSKNKVGKSLLAVWQIWRNPEYCQWIDDYDLHTVFKFQELGPLNADKPLYIIGDLINDFSGFFACWMATCHGLMVTDTYGFVPIVDWSHGPYHDKEGWKGLSNPFEYYFEPLSSITIEEAQNSKNVTYYNSHTFGEPIQTYYGFRDENTIDRFARINSKYIHIREELYEQIMGEIHGLLGDKKTLAAHVRGAEWGKIKSHPIPASLSDYASKIDAAIDKYNFEQIFLATDSDDTVSFFRKRYGDIVVYYHDAERASSGSKILPIFYKDSSRANEGYWLGYEVLRDMLTLSLSDGLVAGYSCVSFAAQVFKRSRGEDYQHKDFVDQELYKKGDYATQEVPKLIEQEKRSGKKQ